MHAQAVFHSILLNNSEAVSVPDPFGDLATVSRSSAFTECAEGVGLTVEFAIDQNLLRASGARQAEALNV